MDLSSLKLPSLTLDTKEQIQPNSASAKPADNRPNPLPETQTSSFPNSIKPPTAADLILQPDIIPQPKISNEVVMNIIRKSELNSALNRVTHSVTQTNQIPSNTHPQLLQKIQTEARKPLNEEMNNIQQNMSRLSTISKYTNQVFAKVNNDRLPTPAEVKSRIDTIASNLRPGFQNFEDERIIIDNLYASSEIYAQNPKQETINQINQGLTTRMDRLSNLQFSNLSAQANLGVLQPGSSVPEELKPSFLSAANSVSASINQGNFTGLEAVKNSLGTLQTERIDNPSSGIQYPANVQVLTATNQNNIAQAGQFFPALANNLASSNSLTQAALNMPNNAATITTHHNSFSHTISLNVLTPLVSSNMATAKPIFDVNNTAIQNRIIVRVEGELQPELNEMMKRDQAKMDAAIKDKFGNQVTFITIRPQNAQEFAAEMEQIGRTAGADTEITLIMLTHGDTVEHSAGNAGNAGNLGNIANFGNAENTSTLQGSHQGFFVLNESNQMTEDEFKLALKPLSNAAGVMIINQACFGGSMIAMNPAQWALDELVA